MEQNINILIIETDPSILAGLEEKLRSLGLNLSVNAAPESHIDQLETLRPELAILGPSLAALGSSSKRRVRSS